MTEAELNQRIDFWRYAEDIAKATKDKADAAKQEMLTAMNQLGLKSQDTPIGRVTLAPTQKCNIVIKRSEFEDKLRREGLYDQFCSTKFDLDLVKAYVTNTGDDLYGAVEVETGYAVRFTANHDNDPTPKEVDPA